jgi:hypothetical protein
MNGKSRVSINKKESIDRFNANSKSASDSIRLVVSALLLPMFGLAYKENAFDFHSFQLFYALVLLSCYFILDVFQYLLATLNAHLFNNQVLSQVVIAIFYTKFFLGISGFLFILLSIFDKFSLVDI